MIETPMTDNNTDCIHNKIYSGQRVCSSPPQWAWICKNCGELGYEISERRPATDLNKYSKVHRRHYGGNPELPIAEAYEKDSKPRNKKPLRGGTDKENKPWE